MAVHNNYNLFLLIMLLPCHLAQPLVAPSPGPASSGTPSSSPMPAQGSRLSPGTAPPRPAQAPSQGSTSSPGSGTTSPRPPQAPTQGSRSSPGPSPAQTPNPGSRSSPGPTPSASGPAAGPSSDSFLDDDEIDSQEYAEEEDNSISSPSSSIDPGAQPPSKSTDIPIQFDFSPTLAPSADIDLQVQKICDFTDYPSICLATVSPYLNGETDVPSVLDVAIEATAQFTKYGQTTAKKLAGNPENTPQLVAVLNECSDRFEKAMDSYGKASDAIPEHDKTTLNTMLTAVVAFVADCRDANSQDSELYTISDKIISMTTNCLSMSSLMD